MTQAIYIHGFSTVSALGIGNDATLAGLFAESAPDLVRLPLVDGREMPAASVALPDDDLRRRTGIAETRNNRLAALALSQLPDSARRTLQDTPRDRLGVVVGTSTSGIAESSAGLKAFHNNANWPDGFDLSVQELGDPALFLGDRVDAGGPVYAISTACTSGAKAIITGARLIRQGLCDTVLCGGVDTLCDMTLNGFGVLEALSSERCNPFSTHRDGIHIGEGAALFVLSAEPSAIRIAGWGESSDAHHISAPDPEGRGACLAMQQALETASIAASDIGYVNLHGTATRQNDAMEAAAVAEVLGSDVPVSSTKPLTGHTLGAAGAVEAALAALALESGRVPRNRNDGVADPALAAINLAVEDQPLQGRLVMSCNYAFGGNNTALILEKA